MLDPGRVELWAIAALEACMALHVNSPVSGAASLTGVSDTDSGWMASGHVCL